MSFNAVERIVEYLELDQEAPPITEIRPSSEVSPLFFVINRIQFF